jgi:hypothetical protein
MLTSDDKTTGLSERLEALAKKKQASGWTVTRNPGIGFKFEKKLSSASSSKSDTPSSAKKKQA